MQKNKRILIAEDDDNTREILTKLLKHQGYEVIAVNGGVDLLKVNAEVQFDLIITDLMMSDLNGVSATEIMKINGIPIPVVALTGISHDEVDQVKDSFVKIFSKPCNASELIAYIELLIG